MDQPLLTVWEYTYIELFWELNTERFYENGPIPSSQIRNILNRKGLDLKLEKSIAKVIRELDYVLQDWIEKNREQLKRSRGG